MRGYGGVGGWEDGRGESDIRFAVYHNFSHVNSLPNRIEQNIMRSIQPNCRYSTLQSKSRCTGTIVMAKKKRKEKKKEEGE